MKPWRRPQLGNRIVGVTTLNAVGARIVRRNFGVLALLLSLVVIALLLTGCAHRGISNLKFVIPRMPPKPTTAATAGAIESAAANAGGAQSSVRAGRELARKDEGPAAVPHLDKADASLDAALGDLAAAKAHATELEGKIAADRAAHEAREAAWKSEIGNLKLEISAAAAENKKLVAENAKLTNEVQRTAWRWMVGIGTLCLALAAAAVVAFFFAGFAAGLKLGPPLAAMGGMCLAVATMLSKIILAAQIAVGAGFACVLAYGAWTFWQSHRAFNSVVVGVQSAKKMLDENAVNRLSSALRIATSGADKAVIAALKSRLFPKAP